jgi:hypothetical protein
MPRPVHAKPSFPRYSDKPAVSGKATQGVTHNLARTLGHEIGKAAADNIEISLPQIVFAWRLDLEGSEPMQDMMRVDPGDRPNVSLRAGADRDIIGGRLSTHRGFTSDRRTVPRACDAAAE